MKVDSREDRLYSGSSRIWQYINQDQLSRTDSHHQPLRLSPKISFLSFCFLLSNLWVLLLSPHRAPIPGGIDPKNIDYLLPYKVTLLTHGFQEGTLIILQVLLSVLSHVCRYSNLFMKLIPQTSSRSRKPMGASIQCLQDRCFRIKRYHVRFLDIKAHNFYSLLWIQ